MLFKRKEYFFIPLVLLLIALVVTNIIPSIAAVLVMAFALTLSAYQYFLQHNKPFGFYVCWLVVIVFGIGIGVYRPSDFSYPLVFSVNQLHDGGLPFSLYVNIPKMVSGYIILFLLLSKAPIDTYIRSQVNQYFLAIGLGVLVLIVAYAFLHLQFYVKALVYISAFAWVNLLVTCVAEEAFMRLLLQAQLQEFMARKTNNKYWQELIPLLITTCIFVLTHFSHGALTMFVFALAGFVYGLVYCLTKNVWACVMVHFTVNIIHFSFLTYPLA